MSSLSLNNAELVRDVLMLMGVSRSAADLDEATEADLRSIMRRGLRRFYFPTVNGQVYQWRWLERTHTIPAEPVFDTGTIAISGGEITLSDGLWPADAVDYLIRVGGHIVFAATREDDTTLTTTNTQLTIEAGTKFTAIRYRYPLPEDFGEWLGGVTYVNGQYTRMLAGSSESELRLRYAIGHTGSNETTHYAITTAPEGKEFHVILWPVPKPDAFLQGVYLSVPGDLLPEDLTTPGTTIQVQPMYADAVVQCILAAAEEYLGQPGIHTQRSEIALQSAILHDRQTGGYYDFSHRAIDLRHTPPRVLPIDFSQALI